MWQDQVCNSSRAGAACPKFRKRNQESSSLQISSASAVGSPGVRGTDPVTEVTRGPSYTRPVPCTCLCVGKASSAFFSLV